MNKDSIQDNKLKLLGKLTASLFHEIRNPLSVIKLDLDLILSDENQNLNSEVLESIQECKSALNRIEEMTDNVLNVARKSNNVKDFVSLSELIHTVMNLMIVKASKKSVSVTSRIKDDSQKIYGNQNKLIQVILNLVGNAIESCDKNGKVVISSGRDENGYQILEIEDNGCGISEEDQKKIFDDFFTKKKHGTGLGLSVCKMLLEEINAQLSFRSELNKGTVFKITFPKTEGES